MGWPALGTQREEEQAEQAEATARLRVEKNLGMIEERCSADRLVHATCRAC